MVASYTSGHVWLQMVTGFYSKFWVVKVWLKLVKGGYECLQGFIGINGVASGYGWLWVVTSGYQWVQVVTFFYSWLRITDGYRWFGVVVVITGSYG